MKKLKALVITLAVAALMVLLPEATSVTANAAEAKNYAVKYISNDSQWRYQEGSTFDESKYHREIYYLLQDLKDGDKVAVYSDVSNASELNLGSVKLGELTICGTVWAPVRTGGVTLCNVLAGSTCSISGDIDTAHVYDVATVTFVSNVTELIATAKGTEFYSNIGCGGTVWHLHAYSEDQPRSFYDLYNFQANKLDITNGNLQTASYHYDSAAPATPTPTVAPTATPAPNTSNPGSASSSSDEYDDVPKTGEVNVIVWLLAIAAISLVGSQILRRNAKRVK